MNFGRILNWNGWTLSILGCVLFLSVWTLYIVPEIQSLSSDFRYELDLESEGDFYDELRAMYSGPTKTISHFSYSSESLSRDSQILIGVFSIRRPTGEKIFSTRRKYAIDSTIKKHIETAGDRARDGYLFGPAGAVRDFIYWHPAYDAPLQMRFQDFEEIQGLRLAVYESRFEVDQTATLRELEGIPEKRGVLTSVYLRTWIEPESGWLVKFSDQATATYYDIKSKAPLDPWMKFHNTVSRDSEDIQIQNAKVERTKFLVCKSVSVLAFCLLFLLVVGRLFLWRWSLLQRFREWISVEFLLSFVAILSGVIVLAAWFLKIDFILQIVPTFAPIQANTAICFIGLGLGTWFAKRNQTRFQMLFASIPLIIGLLTLGEYFFEINLGIDEMIVKAHLFTRTTHPGRMSPHTAFCFVLLGLTMLILRRNLLSWRAFLLTFLTGIVFAFGTAALIGYLTQIPSLGSISMTPMAAYTAFLMLVLSSGILITLRRHRSSLLQEEILAASSGVVCLLLLCQGLSNLNDESIRREVKAAAISKELILYQSIGQRILSLERMASRWKHNRGGELAWREDALESLIDQYSTQLKEIN